MARQEYAVEQLQLLFRSKKVRTKQELLSEVGCGGMTLYRLLSQVGYLSSYNENGRFYTLSRIPRFDAHGLWSYRGIRFSRYSTLTETIVGLVRNSSCGMTGNELTQLLGVNVAPSLSRLVRQHRVGSDRSTRAFRYYDPDNSRAKVQKERWRSTQQAPLPELTVVVAILVELVVGMHDSRVGIHNALKQKMVHVSMAQLNAVFDHYDLKKKLTWI